MGRRELTQRELAAISGVALRTIARQELHPHMTLRRDAQSKLARALKVKPVDLA